MRNFIAQQVIFLSVMTLLFSVSCKNENKGQPENTKAEWQQKSPKQKWDYAGSYQVTLPCTDCKGIVVELQLKEDGSYKIVQNYNENDDTAGEIKTESGQFKWSENDSLIILNNQKFRVSDNVLSWNNPEVERMAADSTKNYTLRMISKDSITK
ncbi:copper resistance protein NlpE N-terminal domain-containing protein [Zunongwangia endophytica]|uniref:Copper resistance protein NlpE N-terminal domain-containing protein n=1 Tax=Zunongwangia endophytica TaxID=1808945 RepID=A0ABV8H8B4_9FLAO|nr:copper resistance protein NlpE N-terminal domain-containing protein [Zunongwangia endophytica]MDN3595007.1 copper resistance protein NlpE N-terminal domain-containing protein [Zunongwangia endophytica]